jgi:hypothetical protein
MDKWMLYNWLRGNVSKANQKEMIADIEAMDKCEMKEAVIEYLSVITRELNVWKQFK